MLRIKVCGLSDPYNAEEILSLHPEFFGLNFYSHSPRFVFSASKEWNFIHDFPASVPTGIFVNADVNYILKKTKDYFLKCVQLHGNETPELAEELKKKDLIIIKAFSVSEKEDFDLIKKYKRKIDFCLFDTRTNLFGGSGKHFEWNLLKHYVEETPFFLSGGISPDDVEDIKSIQHPMFYGIDINSKFELQTNKKDFSKVKKFIDEIRSAISHGA
jgi:phosphoribosylanthranilate isomerase